MEMTSGDRVAARRHWLLPPVEWLQLTSCMSRRSIMSSALEDETDVNDRPDADETTDVELFERVLAMDILETGKLNESKL